MSIRVQSGFIPFYYPAQRWKPQPKQVVRIDQNGSHVMLTCLLCYRKRRVYVYSDACDAVYPSQPDTFPFWPDVRRLTDYGHLNSHHVYSAIAETHGG